MTDAVAIRDDDRLTPVKVEEVKEQVALIQELMSSVMHDGEHYGNLVTYMRLNKMVPPSSQGN